ncbi:CHAT domain-containing protein [Nostoc punctiforme]|uniref:CHAT domain-containing protein n=1 Tax=Nostoc punctiforme TaxID=272131 RepID=UPI001F2B3421|nr:CHAT domain-containing protein [Nostoc punctiforme]
MANNKVLAQTTNADEPSILETQTSTSNRLQKLLIEQNKPEAALEISERSRNRALVDILSDRSSSSVVKPLSTEQIKQVAKQQNATLVQYSIINDEFNIEGKKQTRESELYIWVIKPTGEIAFRSVDLKPLWQKENTSLADLITHSRRTLGVSSNYLKGIVILKHPEQKNNPSQQLQKLHQLLIAPIANILPNQADAHIIFIPQGELFLVPFTALKDTKGKYLIEQHTISTAPSIQALNLLYQRQQKIQGVAKDVLIVGNPTMPSISLKPGESPQKLSQLPGAEQEAKDIASIFNTQALTGDAATETTVVQKMPQAKIIHLATQGGCNDSLEITCGLALAPSQQDDGWLTSEEILKLNLKADLVVLSSNDTALGKITADGVIGLSRSFFAAAVPSVIGSLWSVPDKETAFLMIEFYQKLSENPDKAAALRHAMLATMKKYPNPRDWAAFTLIGVL